MSIKRAQQQAVPQLQRQLYQLQLQLQQLQQAPVQQAPVQQTASIKSLALARRGIVSALKLLTAGAECPLCGNDSDSNYLGLNVFECSNAECDNYSKKTLDQKSFNLWKMDIHEELSKDWSTHEDPDTSDLIDFEDWQQQIYEGEHSERLADLVAEGDDKYGEEAVADVIRDHLKKMEDSRQKSEHYIYSDMSGGHITGPLTYSEFKQLKKFLDSVNDYYAPVPSTEKRVKPDLDFSDWADDIAEYNSRQAVTHAKISKFARKGIFADAKILKKSQKR